MGDTPSAPDDDLQRKGVPPEGGPKPPQHPHAAPDPGQDSAQRDDSDGDTGGGGADGDS